ncbi:MAG: ATP-binding cassette domain-containing protein [candidate division WOR-3 bacterium]
MIRVNAVSKSFGGRLVLDKVTLEVPENSIAVIVGALGSGKSVLLRIMAGLLTPDSGSVEYDGGRGTGEMSTHVGYVFQSGALFDSMTVWENVALPLAETQRIDKKELIRRVVATLQRVGMADAVTLLPRQLSGGMSRLVAIARSIVTDPRYVFLDEPTAGLDPATRSRVVELIRSLRENEGRTCVVVTHDLETANVLADRLYMLRNARLEQVGQVRKEDYETPCT